MIADRICVGTISIVRETWLGVAVVVADHADRADGVLDISRPRLNAPPLGCWRAWPAQVLFAGASAANHLGGLNKAATRA
jgi:hypothetical protein